MSNAFNRSIKTAPRMFPLSTSFLILSVKYVTVSSVERLDRNPNWKDDSKPLFSSCDNNCLYTILSKILDNTGSIDIGL